MYFRKRLNLKCNIVPFASWKANVFKSHGMDSHNLLKTISISDIMQMTNAIVQSFSYVQQATC